MVFLTNAKVPPPCFSIRSFLVSEQPGMEISSSDILDVSQVSDIVRTSKGFSLSEIGGVHFT